MSTTAFRIIGGFYNKNKIHSSFKELIQNGYFKFNTVDIPLNIFYTKLRNKDSRYEISFVRSKDININNIYINSAKRFKSDLLESFADSLSCVLLNQYVQYLDEIENPTKDDYYNIILSSFAYYLSLSIIKSVDINKASEIMQNNNLNLSVSEQHTLKDTCITLAGLAATDNTSGEEYLRGAESYLHTAFRELVEHQELISFSYDELVWQIKNAEMELVGDKI